jgi:hypothetical protein
MLDKWTSVFPTEWWTRGQNNRILDRRVVEYWIVQRNSSILDSVTAFGRENNRILDGGRTEELMRRRTSQNMGQEDGRILDSTTEEYFTG